MCWPLNLSTMWSQLWTWLKMSSQSGTRMHPDLTMWERGQGLWIWGRCPSKRSASFDWHAVQCPKTHGNVFTERASAQWAEKTCLHYFWTASESYDLEGLVCMTLDQRFCFFFISVFERLTLPRQSNLSQTASKSSCLRQTNDTVEKTTFFAKRSDVCRTNVTSTVDAHPPRLSNTSAINTPHSGHLTDMRSPCFQTAPSSVRCSSSHFLPSAMSSSAWRHRPSCDLSCPFATQSDTHTNGTQPNPSTHTNQTTTTTPNPITRNLNATPHHKARCHTFWNTDTHTRTTQTYTHTAPSSLFVQPVTQTK